MVDAPAAFQATFCGFRSVGSRKMTAITMEVPVEHSERVLRILGHPDALNPRWFAIALLDTGAAAKAQGSSEPVLSKPVPTKDRRRFDTLPLSQQAALKCEDRAFRRFLAEDHSAGLEDTAEDAACVVRAICGIQSRAELDSTSAAGQKWLALRDRYEAWMRAA